jgi:hypothetical protein
MKFKLIMLSYEQENLPFGLQSTNFLNFSSEKNPILMNAFRYNTNNCPHDHVLMFFTHTIFCELESTLMLQKTKRIVFFIQIERNLSKTKLLYLT